MKTPGHAERIVGAEAFAGGRRFGLDGRKRAAGAGDVRVADCPCRAELREDQDGEWGKVTHRATVLALWLTTDSLLCAERLAAEFDVQPFCLGCVAFGARGFEAGGGFAEVGGVEGVGRCKFGFERVDLG